MKSVLLSAATALVLAVTGCARPQCEAVCAVGNSCGVDERAYDVDCPEYCLAVTELQERAVANNAPTCEAEYQQHLDCRETQGDAVCDQASTSCEDTAQAWSDCLETYCAARAAADAQDPVCDSEGSPLMFPL